MVMASQMPTIAAMPAPDIPSPGKIEPGNTTVLASAAGRMSVGIGMGQNGVRPAIISSIGIPIVPRIAMTLWMKPTGNRNPNATKNQRRQR